MTINEKLQRAVERLTADARGATLRREWRGKGGVQRDLRALLSERAELLAAVERMRGGLEKIERWHGEFPSEDWVNDDGSCTPAPYGVRYGSNGERDFMRGVARAALTTGEGK